jgi:dTDP-4-dehydrorhamnose 3,5-epimerase
MDIIKTPLLDLFVLKPKVFEDNRGYFFESFSQVKLPEQFRKLQFIQDNQSLSFKKGTLRGIHFQIYPKAQTKLVRCIKGSILDVAVDLRIGSPTYLKVFSVELTEVNKLQLLVPQGYGHAFITLEDNTIVAYKVDEYFSKEHDRSVRFDDPFLNIDWKGLTPILSDKDASAELLTDSDVNFSYPL